MRLFVCLVDIIAVNGEVIDVVSHFGTVHTVLDFLPGEGFVVHQNVANVGFVGGRGET